jgi:hypothetical protein
VKLVKMLKWFLNLRGIDMFSKLGGLGKLIWEEDKPKADATPAPAQAPAQQAQVIAPAFQFGGTPGAATTQTVAASGESILDVETIRESINGAIAGSAEFAPAASFLQVVTSLQNVPGLSNDEGTRFKAAQATQAATNPGVTPQTILTAVKSYEGVLANEASRFEGSFVAAANAELTDLSHQADTLQSQISDLAQQLAHLTDQRTEILASVTKKKADLAKAKIDFNSVTTTLSAKYEDLAQKVKQHLGA